jgi:uncharacterized Zn finger protein
MKTIESNVKTNVACKTCYDDENVVRQLRTTGTLTIEKYNLWELYCPRCGRVTEAIFFGPVNLPFNTNCFRCV